VDHGIAQVVPAAMAIVVGYGVLDGVQARRCIDVVTDYEGGALAVDGFGGGSLGFDWVGVSSGHQHRSCAKQCTTK
jgi:hypothetical protein